jgi:hypothetical protein
VGVDVGGGRRGGTYENRLAAEVRGLSFSDRFPNTEAGLRRGSSTQDEGCAVIAAFVNGAHPEAPWSGAHSLTGEEALHKPVAGDV